MSIASNERYKAENDEDWRGLCNRIPFVAFPAKWKIAIIPPFGGAIARFLVKLPGHKGQKSIYLDFFDRLGCYGEPYWEVYPVNGDVGRCDLADTKTLLKLIKAKA